MITENQRIALNNTINTMMELDDEEIRAIMKKDSEFADFLYENDAEILTTVS